ncbi:hypothetical protein, partial [Streptomyces bacillaris]
MLPGLNGYRVCGAVRAAGHVVPIPAPAGGALDAAEEAVDLLLDSGRAPGDILVLTTGEQHPWATHELSFGEAAYWAQQDAGDDVFFADASAVDRAKPRPVVVVAVNGDADETVARALPVARDRAAALLLGGGGPPTRQNPHTARGGGPPPPTPRNPPPPPRAA